jgi:predicted nucleic acid-binding protein
VSGVVSDTSPLIALHDIGGLGLLRTLFGTVLIPPAVARE